MKALARLPILAFKLLAWVLVIAAPTIGVWVASSLAAYLNGPIWLACLAGLFLFPLLPLAWDLWGSRRFAKKQQKRREDGKEPRERIVTFWDRMILRTFFVNIAFLAVLLAAHPQAGFTALASRGDWFLEQAPQQYAEPVRPVLFASAEGLEWLYEATRDNPYEQWADDEPLPKPTADEIGDVQSRPTGRDKADADEPKPTDGGDERKPTDDSSADDADDTKPTVDDEEAVVDSVVPDQPTRTQGQPPAWPIEPRLHPVVANMPTNVETDYASVARYIAEREKDPFLRVKAMHDWTAEHVVYDVAALRAGDFPPQDAKTVFETKKAVCAGYARLLEAMADVTGDEIVYVTGDARDQDGGIAGGGHAWNAAKIEGKWYLIDATWDAGGTAEGKFKKNYRTNYLFTPPSVFGMDHLPDDDAWQLRKEPITRGEFVRQPQLEPEFFVQGLELVSPKRSQFEATGDTVQIRLENPERRRVLGRIVGEGGGQGERCHTRGRTDVSVVCKVGGDGTFQLRLFAGDPDLTTYPSVGAFEVTAR